MRVPTSSGYGAAASRRAEESSRPIASGLKLGSEHVEKIDRSHERCQALGVSRIEHPAAVTGAL